MVDFGSQIPPKKLGGSPPLLHLESVRFSSYVMHRFKVAREPAKRPQDPPQGRPKTLQEAPKSAPGGFKRASRDPKSRSRGLKTRPRAPKSLPRRPQGFSEAPGPAAVFGKFKKFKSWLQKASITLKIADIDESQRPCLKSQNEKRRAGGGDPPWGSQSAATRRVRACLVSFRNLLRILRTQRV